MDTEIDCVNHSIESLAPLRRFAQLRRLRLWLTDPHRYQVHPLADLSPLQSLENLELLELPKSAVNDLGPLQGLKSVKHRPAFHTSSQPGTAARLRALKKLDVSDTPVDDVSALKDLRGLTVLAATAPP